jgi:hypothetical protein
MFCGAVDQCRMHGIALPHGSQIKKEAHTFVTL